MAKMIKLELTPAQFVALKDIVDESSAMIGCGDDDEIRIKRIKLIDRMLKKNGHKRDFI